MLARDGGARRAPTDLYMMVHARPLSELHNPRKTARLTRQLERQDVATKEGSTSEGPCKTTANQPQISKRQRTPVTKKRKCSFQGCLGSAVSRGMDL
ncbi:hypothetical protein PF011_g27222 [Phytophthora fragariae]|uniref:Uncharacterized protein n=1 Tax=Phytophthora fragariae TaxID=53985 RepID=A0A6A3HHQ7_9STRA|nr:hypothetical protein PF011_g27222 [Phytophthora fragariae]